MSRNLLRLPWLSSLLDLPLLCRGLVIAAAILGILHFLGLSLLPCPFSTLTGLPCGGCGVTRATAALLRGNLTTALHYHPFSPALALLGLLMTFSAIAPAPSRQWLVATIRLIEQRTFLPTLVLLAFLIYGILRTIGVTPSTPIVQPSPVMEWLHSRRSVSDTGL